jgi:hypothetical protein
MGYQAPYRASDALVFDLSQRGDLILQTTIRGLAVPFVGQTSVTARREVGLVAFRYVFPSNG